jgi:Domain of unknown function (DUF397)
VDLAGDAVLVRDSKDPDGAVLTFTVEEWDAFQAGVLAGEFARPPRSAGGRRE